MGKSKRKHPDIEEILARPWCYYCERDFDDLKILISHQKAKHYKCDRCGRRLNTAGGLQVHLSQVHKETLDKVENALPNRQGIDIEVFGMEGIPEDIIQAHNQRLTQEFYAGEAARREMTGNPVAGANGQGNAGVKKPKFESPAELKKRLAEHKAKKAAEQAGGSLDSGPDTPGPQAGSPPSMPYQQPYPAPQASPPQSAFSPQYGQPPPFFGQQPPPFEYAEHQYGGPPAPQAPFAPPAPQVPFAPPARFGPPPPQFPPAPQYGEQRQPMGYPPNPFNQFPPGPGPGPPSAYPASPFPPQQFNQRPPPSNSPGPPGLPGPPGPPRQHSLPSAPGLPQRPAFNAPQVSRSQLHEMHSGHMVGPGAAQTPKEHQAQPNGQSEFSSSVDDLISSAQQSAQASITPAPATPATPTAQIQTHTQTQTQAQTQTQIQGHPRTPEPTKLPEKQVTPKPTVADSGDASKKTKKSSRMIYSDPQMSPEEKMARMSRYSFNPSRRGGEKVLGPVEAAVTGVVSGPDDVPDTVQG